MARKDEGKEARRGEGGELVVLKEPATEGGGVDRLGILRD